MKSRWYWRGDPYPMWFYYTLSGIVVALAVSSLMYAAGGFLWFREPDPVTHQIEPSRPGALRVIAFWALFPPSWFFFEYWRIADRVDPATLAGVKAQQECARPIWAGLVAVLIVLAEAHFD